MKMVSNNSRIIKAQYILECANGDYAGVRYKPEHGCMYPILKFDKFFNLDVTLNGI